MKRSDFKITRTQAGWRLTNVRDEGDRHAHFFKKKGALDTMTLILNKVLPDKEYFRVAAQRLLPEKDYKKLVPGKKPKDRYVNVQRKKGGVKGAYVRR